MEETTILLKLKKIKATLEESCLDTNDVNWLIAKQEEKIMLSKVSNPSEKKALKKRLSFLNKLRKGDRPILGYADIQNINNHDYVCFSDRIKLFCLYKNDNSLPFLKNAEDENIKKLNYPEISRIISNDRKNIAELVYKDVTTAVKLNKSKEYEKIIRCTFDGSNFYNLNFIKEIFEILGANELKIEYDTYKILYLTDTLTGNFALLMPLTNPTNQNDAVFLKKER
ncbi:hypothetical protein CWE04_11650 [Thomasclavelia cocleata]|uniref:Uncharacterized protein n=1 Tax=Thomasclavelia cocleata TaxID=69824 RepID=A0A1I0BH08_9FIRM|nr:hypothetical protein [Thomasclavelia cocleata]MCR1960242.1 hypothetical protein [Thomasclavelia cocleata]NDO41784.1 hypothetical protein [Thomasclavelia cocleata]PJN79856.1 hypothetical protein CWE04_11650 [Thomasclavelia cocleata]SET06254.1 hypothetical protein SAMN04489758_101123 [Thomasclavelia cocleata]